MWSAITQALILTNKFLIAWQSFWSGLTLPWKRRAATAALNAETKTEQIVAKEVRNGDVDNLNKELGYKE